MRFTRLFSALGLVAVLGAATVPAALAAPSDDLQPVYSQTAERPWRQFARHHWDDSQSWYQRSVVLPPTALLPQPVTVRVVVPQPVVPTFAVPTFVAIVQQTVLPALTQVVPAEVFVQTAPRFVQVQPGFWVVAHPSLYWAPDNAWAAYEYAAWLQASGMAFQPYYFQGPQGYGVYLAFQGGQYGGWGY